MGECRTSFRSGGGVGEFKIEVLSGKSSYGGETKRSRSPDAAAARRSDAAMPWRMVNDPEVKRRKRIARYKVYAMEGRVKATIRKGVWWIKNKCSRIIHGY
ncbi:unnamed protein product [Cuscuta campestris]|uniref:DUF3511 domain-containing protein n=1 Tax=Cuscuta campestris TaxID=132261 RepID=A0A484LCP7_9ASTE|nr:unnamed protein product [Cuscuta campestris]